MSQTGTILHASRVVVPIAGHPGGATVLLIYTGEVQCSFVSGGNTTVRDQLLIHLPDGNLAAQDLVGFEAGKSPIPIILPTSWNDKGGSLSVIAVNDPVLNVSSTSGVGLILSANIAVQNGMLLNVQYQLSVLAKKA